MLKINLTKEFIMKVLKKAVLASLIALTSVAVYAGNDNFDKSAEHAKKSQREAKAGVKAVTSDALITAKVKASFIEDQNLSALDIHVVTKNHCVTLTGKVSTELQKNTAIYLAKNVEGVKHVYASNLEII
jgi:hyperosmotically inducible periplasmic protein